MNGEPAPHEHHRTLRNILEPGRGPTGTLERITDQCKSPVLPPHRSRRHRLHAQLFLLHLLLVGPNQKRFFNQVEEREWHLARKQLEDEETLADGPEKFLDPIMNILMLDPVNLPRTALHWACKNSQTSMVSLLLSRGSDITIRTITGQTPRDLTTSLEVATLLQSCESPPVSPNSRSPITDRLPYDPPHNMMGFNRHDSLMSQHSLQETVIKIRIANSSDTDFIEVELSRHVTYQNLLTVCCQELAVSPEQVNRIRKLPDTRIRSDADVRRLRPLQELEVVLKDAIVSGPPQMPTNNIYPSISSNKNQTVLY